MQVSGETARMIDEEVRAIIDDCYARAQQMLSDNEDKLHAMADALIELETLDAKQIGDIMEGMPPRPPQRPSDGPDAGGAAGDDSRGAVGGPAEEV
jgi:cell division protease FtsH